MKQFRITVTANEAVVWEGQALAGLTLGRGADNECVIPEKSVSGHHAHLIEVAGALHIEDLGSGNKTRVKGGSILGQGERAPLVDGMVLALGRARIQVEVAPSSEAAPTDTILQSDERSTVDRPPSAVPGLLDRGSGAILDSDFIETKVGPPASEGTSPSTAAPASATKNSTGVSTVGAEPAVGRSLSGSSLRTIGYQGTGPDSNVLKAEADRVLEALRVLRPRLVFDDDSMRGVVPIESPDILIGRSRSADIRVGHDGISSRHCRLYFDFPSRSFILEDLGSSNGTEIGGQRLLPKQPAMLQPESHIRLGPAGALFVVERDSRGEELPEARFDLTLKILKASAMSATIAEAIRSAAKESSQVGHVGHVGERLILSGAVSAWEWARAWEKARTFQVPTPRSSKRWLPYVLAIGALLILAATLMWILS